MLEEKAKSFEAALGGLNKKMGQIGWAAWLASLAIVGGNGEATAKLIADIFSHLVKTAHALV